ncbi:MAG: MoaD/ThiS family protein [Candidatus Poribacteria bacterium]
MNIEVRLFANLTQMLPPGSQNKRARMTVENGTTIGGMLNILKINHSITKILMVNGVQKSIETELYEGDVVSVFPPIAGG